MPLSERRWLLAVVWLASVGFTCGLTVADPDLWGHTLYGLRALDRGVLAESTDPFSYTAPGALWINHEWLSESEYGWLWRHFGSSGLVLWRTSLAIGLFAAAAMAHRRVRGTLPAAALLWIFSAECLSDFFVFVRPQLVTLACFTLTLELLRGYWDEPRAWRLVPLPPLMLFWTNHHGGFLAGIGLIGLVCLAGLVRLVRERKNGGIVWLCLAGLASGAATFINPYGPRLHAMLWDHLVPAQAVSEWQPLWSGRQSLTYYIPFAVAALAVVGSRRWKWIDLCVLAVVGFQALCHLRHVALLCAATLVLLPQPLGDVLGRMFRTLSDRLTLPQFRRWRWAAVGGAAAVLAMMQIVHTAKTIRHGVMPWDIATLVERDVPGVPFRAVSILDREQVRGRLITDYAWGQYVLWQLYPRIRVAFDGRYRTIYPAQVESEFLAFTAGKKDDPAATAILDDYGTQIALLPRGRDCCRLLDSHPDWVRIYADEQAALYVRNVSTFQELIGKSRRGELVGPETAPWRCFPAGPVRELPPLESVARNLVAVDTW